MNKIVRNIPNAITCGNLFCGCLAIVKAFEGDLVWSAYLVGIAAVLDFFDGFAARALKVSSPIGKDLDSLADMVTFGVVPGVVMFILIKLAVFYECAWFSGQPYFFLSYLGFIVPIFSAIRLAKFNNDSRQSDSFIGLPTPANAIFICSLPLILHFSGINLNDYFDMLLSSEEASYSLQKPAENFLSILMNSRLLISLTLIFSLLLVAPLPLFSLKFKSFGWKGNEIRFTFLILSVGLIGFLQFIGIPLVIVLYILMSIVNNLFNRSKKSRA
jgi:CDP-diacylglycerol--serine O-phosphatidyltransferase